MCGFPDFYKKYFCIFFSLLLYYLEQTVNVFGKTFITLMWYTLQFGWKYLIDFTAFVLRHSKIHSCKTFQEFPFGIKDSFISWFNELKQMSCFSM